MVIGCCQFDIAWESPAQNHQVVRQMLDRDPPSAGSMVMLPELFASGYTMNAKAAVEGESARDTSFLSKLAKQYQIFLLGGIARQPADRDPQNLAVLFGPDGVEIDAYQKIHPFTLAGEGRVYSAGERIVVVEVGGMRVCPLICYDLRFPELFREAVAMGAECFAVLANWPAVRAEHWRTLLRARAIENLAYVVGINRIGSDPNADYAGGSVIIGPTGETVACAEDRPMLLWGEITRHRVVEARERFPALGDMRRFEHGRAQ